MPRCQACNKLVLPWAIDKNHLCKDCATAQRLQAEKAEEERRRRAKIEEEISWFKADNERQALAKQKEAAEQQARAQTATLQSPYKIVISVGGHSHTIDPGNPKTRYKSIRKHFDELDLLVEAQYGAFVAFDLETTGLSSYDDEIIEIGAVKVAQGSIVETFSQLIKPKNPIPQSATNINHITNDMVKDMPSIEDVLPDYFAFIGDLPCVAHNARFDMDFLSCAAFVTGIKDKQIACADSLSISRTYWRNLSNHKLATMADVVGYDLTNAHRAVDDAIAVAHIVIAATIRASEFIAKRSLGKRLVQYISENAPVVQKDIASIFPDDDPDSIRSTIRELADKGELVRAKSGSSYIITMPD